MKKTRIIEKESIHKKFTFYKALIFKNLQLHHFDKCETFHIRLNE